MVAGGGVVAGYWAILGGGRRKNDRRMTKERQQDEAGDEENRHGREVNARLALGAPLEARYGQMLLQLLQPRGAVVCSRAPFCMLPTMH